MRDKIANRIAAFTCPILYFFASRWGDRGESVRGANSRAAGPIIGGNESARKPGKKEIFAG
jgi:hypothetical protein